MMQQRCTKEQQTNSSLRKPVSSQRPFTKYPSHALATASTVRLAEDRHNKACLTFFAGKEAGQAFEKLAQTHLKLESTLEAASSYVDAAKCYQKTSKGGEGLTVCIWIRSLACLTVSISPDKKYILTPSVPCRCAACAAQCSWILHRCRPPWDGCQAA